MDEAPGFFVPESTAETQEAAYADLAAWCRCPIPPAGQRVYSICFVHDGEEWTATVGERLRGVRLRTTRSRGQKIVERQGSLSDPAVVLAIFPGTPYRVATNHVPGAAASAWENPFMARPKSVTYFRE